MDPFFRLGRYRTDVDTDRSATGGGIVRHHARQRLLVRNSRVALLWRDYGRMVPPHGRGGVTLVRRCTDSSACPPLRGASRCIVAPCIWNSRASARQFDASGRFGAGSGQVGRRERCEDVIVNSVRRQVVRARIVVAASNTVSCFGGLVVSVNAWQEIPPLGDSVYRGAK